MTTPVLRPTLPPPRRLLQPVLPLESAEQNQRIPESHRAKCVQLFRQLLERVVLQRPESPGGNDER